MQIVIDIPEKDYDKMCKGELVDTILVAIKNGTPLPKGHGRLIDADKLEPRDVSPDAWYSPLLGFELDDIEDAPTIIEADRSESEGEE